MATYYRLLDPKRKGTIVKTDGNEQYLFDPKTGWIKTGVMLEYFWPDSDIYDRYEEISEQTARKLTGGTA